MKEVIYLLTNEKELDFQVEAFLIALKDYSCRSMYEFDLEKIKEIKKKTRKKIYVLFDTLILETMKKDAEDIFSKLYPFVDGIFFQDVLLFNLGLKYQCVDKLFFYSPTLALNPLDLSVWSSLGLKNVIISKECEYEGYFDILKNLKDMKIGMLAYGHPQIYFSKRKMLTSYNDFYQLNIKVSEELRLRELSRDKMLPFYEDKNGSYIFASNIFFPGEYIKEFADSGMKYFLVDTVFENDKHQALELVKQALNEKVENISTFMMFRKLINNYEK